MAGRRILVIGAHPDDCELTVGGTSALWKQAGHTVQWISMTDGGAGHHQMPTELLVMRRAEEAKASGAEIGIEYFILPIPDGQLLPTLENRLRVLRLIRQFKPDLVLTHRPNDYHPDHRYTSQIVQDAAYMVTVPKVAPDCPHLKYNPVFGYLVDDFTKPYPFTPDVVVSVDNELDTILEMAHCHVSQFYEWLAYNHGYEDQLPGDEAGNKAVLKKRLCERLSRRADRFREQLIGQYGAELGRSVQYAEAFEISEYGSPLSNDLRDELFSFAGSHTQG